MASRLIQILNAAKRGKAPSESDLNHLAGVLKSLGYSVKAPPAQLARLLQNPAATGRKALPGWNGNGSRRFSPAEQNPATSGKALPGWQGRNLSPTPANEPQEFLPQFEMIHVRSSNVFAIGYMYDTATTGDLYVQFIAQEGGRGSTYRYDRVPPRLWEDFQNASSPGTWIWDNLRIRHSRVGHRYSYELVGIVGQYVPRQSAIKKGVPGEFFLPRTFHEGQIRGGKLIRVPIRSQLPAQQVSMGGPPITRGPGATSLRVQSVMRPQGPNR